jgi:AraC-like DNA-binding protein
MFDILFLGSIFLVVATVYLLLFTNNASKSFSDFLLSSLLLSQAWGVVIYLLMNSKYILNFPHLYKTGVPINYLAAPLSYLYVKAVLNNEFKLKKGDLFHFIPFILFIVNQIPFYALSANEKLIIINNAISHWSNTYKVQTGIMPEYVNFILRPLQALIYLFFQWKLLLSFKKNQPEGPVQTQIEKVTSWLKIFSWTTTIILAGFFILTFLVILYPTYINNQLVVFVLSLFVAGGFFVMSGYLLTHPAVLSGLPFIKYEVIESKVRTDKSYSMPYVNYDYTKEMEEIRQFFEQEKPFLKTDLNINQVSVALGIPSRELSFIINNHFEHRFTDFLNKYRIEYITKKINKEYLLNYTFESIAKEAGFASKSSFNLAFKKFNNCTPTEFLSNLDQ